MYFINCIRSNCLLCKLQLLTTIVLVLLDYSIVKLFRNMSLSKSNYNMFFCYIHKFRFSVLRVFD